MVEYFHKKLGRVVELVPGQQFSTHWNFYEDIAGVRTIRHGVPELDIVMVQPTTELVLPENWGTPNSQTEETPTTDETISVVQVIEQQIEPTVGFIKLVNLNTETSSYAIALHLPGIGKATAKKICDRRPKDGGYKDFGHLREINNDFNLDDGAWDKVKGLVEF